MADQQKILAEITVIGPDRKGIIANITQYIFQNQGNIEKISQNVIRGLFGMQLEASFKRETVQKEKFEEGLRNWIKNFGMEVKIHFDEPHRLKNMAVLVTKEPHCLEVLLDAQRRNHLKVAVKVIIGTEKSLQPLARKFNVPFAVVEHRDQSEAETKILNTLEKFDIDFIALARYMRILTPNFVWRYPNRIINIHPSLLPAFSGAYAYVQAYERGSQIVGCTAHFVTEELDQGPIIWQDSFRVNPGDSLDQIRKKGQELESKTLFNAVKLYTEKKLEVYWGKVHFGKRMFPEKIKT